MAIFEFVCRSSLMASDGPSAGASALTTGVLHSGDEADSTRRRCGRRWTGPHLAHHHTDLGTGSWAGPHTRKPGRSSLPHRWGRLGRPRPHDPWAWGHPGARGDQANRPGRARHRGGRRNRPDRLESCRTTSDSVMREGHRGRRMQWGDRSSVHGCGSPRREDRLRAPSGRASSHVCRSTIGDAEMTVLFFDIGATLADVSV